MKTRFVATAVVALFALVSVSSQAVAAGTGRHANAVQASQPGCMGANQLGLDKDQIAKVGAIVQKFHADARDVIKSNLSKEDKQGQVKDLKSKAAQDIVALLNADQQAKAEKSGWVDRILSMRRQGGGELGAILKQLNLSADQKASVKAIREDAQTQGKAIKDDTILTKEQKMAKFLELRKATIENIAGVLDDAQRTKFRELLAKQPQSGTGGRGRRQ